MENIEYYVGTTLKFCVNITAQGFSQATDPYEIKVVCNNKVKIYAANLEGSNANSESGDIDIKYDYPVIEGDSDYFILVNTDSFPSGTMKMIVTAWIPDQDCDVTQGGNGYRKEVTVKDLCYLKKP